MIAAVGGWTLAAEIKRRGRPAGRAFLRGNASPENYYRPGLRSFTALAAGCFVGEWAPT